MCNNAFRSVRNPISEKRVLPVAEIKCTRRIFELGIHEKVLRNEQILLYAFNAPFYLEQLSIN